MHLLEQVLGDPPLKGSKSDVAHDEMMMLSYAIEHPDEKPVISWSWRSSKEARVCVMRRNKVDRMIVSMATTAEVGDRVRTMCQRGYGGV